MPTVRYFAAARAAAGVDEDEVVAAGSLAQVLAEVAERRTPRLGAVLAACSFVVDGDPVGRRDHAAVPVRSDGVVEVLPPFAGG